MRIFTVGHSSRELAAFVALLRENGVRLVADVRRFPSSRRHPHFSRPRLEAALADAGIGYVHFEALGGRRPLLDPADPETAGITDPGLRAYAQHSRTDAFRAAFDRLLWLAAEAPVAVMCAEADPARCHRGILTDLLLAREVEVVHILAPGRSEPARPSPRARFGPDGSVCWPAAQGELFADPPG